MGIGIKSLFTMCILVNVIVFIRNTSNFGFTGTMSAQEYIASISEEYLQDFAARLFQLCPILKICNTLVISKHTNQTPCCFQCSCDDECYKTGTCCPHISVPVSRAQEECLHPSVFASNSKHLGTSGFRFVTTCQSEIDEKRRYPCVRPESRNEIILTEMTPVTSATNIVNYVNKDCARCNGADNLHAWQPEIRCIFYPHAVQWKLTDYLPTPAGDCYIHMLPPTAVNVSSTTCYTDRIAECNTRQWKIYDPDIERMCRDVHILLILTMKNNIDFRYNNIFCAICNGHNIEEMSNCALDEDKGDILVITDVLDFGSENTQLVEKHLTTEEVPAVVCGVGRMFDPLTRKCKQVNCIQPLILDLGNNRCKEVLHVSGQTNKGGITIVVRLIPNKQLDFAHRGHITQRVNNYLSIIVQTTDFESRSAVLLCASQMYFKLDRMFREENKAEVKTENPNIYESVVICRFYFESSSDTMSIYYELQETLLKMSNALQEVEPNVRFDVVLGSFDPWELSNPLDTQTFKTPEGVLVYALKDKYSSLSFVEAEGYVGFNTSACASLDIFNILDELSFISCPLFLYDLENVLLERYPDGLQKLDDSDIAFKFDEFRSVNETHVLICVDSVVHRNGVRHDPVRSTVIVYFAFFCNFCIF